MAGRRQERAARFRESPTLTGRWGGPGANTPGAVAPMFPAVPLIAAVLIGPWLAATVAEAAPLRSPTSRAPAMAGTEQYCSGYDETFHGEWIETGPGASRPPMPFRIGADSDGAACYSQLGVMSSRRVAPYELPRFRVESKGGGIRTIRYRDFVLELDTGSATAVQRRGEEPPWTGTLLDGPPPVGGAHTAPPEAWRERWYGKWRGRLSDLPFPVTLRFSRSGGEGVDGRISMLAVADSFTGWFHGEMLVFRWKNRHVGLVMESAGDAIVYNDYKGRVFRFSRMR